MNKYFSILFFVLSLLFITPVVKAEEIQTSCQDRFITMVNPVRGRNMWGDKSLIPIKNQYDEISKYNFPVTWLLQYDALIDTELSGYIKGFSSNQEVGVFLEVTPDFAQKARIIYPHAVPWADPSAIFLSGYSQSERRKLIDTLFLGFKDVYGYFPKSVGAWWIDSYSLSYMKKEYGISAAMIVADQKTTDHYGVWGQWWGVPYFPSKANILTPAKNDQIKEDVAIIQWAQRHPDLAYGEGPIFSNYSFQANDYIRQGKNTNFFKDLTNIYLNCNNLVGQMTIGLETGMESSEFDSEYQKQLSYLSNLKNIKFLSMSNFANEYKDIYTGITEVSLQGPKTKWILNKDERYNQKLGDNIKYNQDISFSDYFISDNSSFLDRRLENRNLDNRAKTYWPFFILVWTLISLLLITKKKFKTWFYGMLFSVSSFGLILKSGFSFGWFVYYGPVIKSLGLTQILLVIFSFWLFSFVKLKKFRLLIILSFGLDYLLSILRYSHFSDSYYLGFMWDALRFVGLKITKPFLLELINNDFPSVTASSLLRFNFDKIWNNVAVSLIIYPLIHILAAFILLKLSKYINIKFQKIFLIILIVFFILHLGTIVNSDPRMVILNK